MPNIPGLRSCYDKVWRLIYFGECWIRFVCTPPQLFQPSSISEFESRAALRSRYGSFFFQRPRHAAHRRRVPHLEPLHRQPWLARRTAATSSRSACRRAASPGKPIEILIDHIEFRRGPRPRRRLGLRMICSGLASLPTAARAAIFGYSRSLIVSAYFFP